MERVNASAGDNVTERIEVRYRDSNRFDAGYHFIHKYYLSPEDKGKLSPADIHAIEGMLYSLDEELLGRLSDAGTAKELPDCPIFYRDIRLEKQVERDLMRRGLLAALQYRRDRNATLTPEEVRAALNLNDWLRGYEKTLLAKQLSIEETLKNGLRGNDPFLVDYEIDLKLDFYLREDDPFYDNEEANAYDWDDDAALMCRLKNIEAYASVSEIADPDYWGLGDDLDHNDIPDHSTHSNPVYRAKHCFLFHELTNHSGVPLKHLIRIGFVCEDFEVQYQNMVDIDLTGERIAARQQDTWTGKLEERDSICRGPFFVASAEETGKD